MPEDKIALLDQYLSEHPTISEIQVQPLALPCGLYIERYWVMQNKFRSKPGKYLGIWTGLKSPSELYNTYGFNQLFISSS